MCLNTVLNVKAVVAAFNQDKALVGAFSVITNLRMELFEALVPTQVSPHQPHSVAVLGPQSKEYLLPAQMVERGANTAGNWR